MVVMNNEGETRVEVSVAEFCPYISYTELRVLIRVAEGTGNENPGPRHPNTGYMSRLDLENIFTYVSRVPHDASRNA